MFVTIEGIDGAGKSTVIKTLEEEFPDAVFTSEPSSLSTGKLLREFLSDEDSHAVTDFMLFMADRKHHIHSIIEPALEEGKMVISDRYADSTRAYQPQQLEDTINDPEVFIEEVMRPWNLRPDLTIYLDISPEVAMTRLDGDEKYENLDNLRRVYYNYENIGKMANERWQVVDAEQSADEVAEEVKTAIGKALER